MPHRRVGPALLRKNNPVVEAFAWGGATLRHADKTAGEDTAVALLKFDGGQLAIIESSWAEQGGMQLRHEFSGSAGRLVTDTSVSPVWGFITRPVGHLVEKADVATGWVHPVPEETRAYGFSEQMRHFVQHFAEGRTPPLETFEDGWIVNCILDACYRAMRSGTWEKIRLES